MTREEAIQEFQNVKDLIRQDGKDWFDERDLELIDMAIEALSADTVSRDVYDKRTKADEEIIDSYRREFQKALSADAEHAKPKPEVTITDTDIMYVGENYKV